MAKQNELLKEEIKTTSAIYLNNFKKNILFTLKDFEGLFIGTKENYKKTGIYNNLSGTLKKITNNEKLYHLLSGNFSHIALAGFINKGRYTIDDIIEFYTICKKLNIKYYNEISETDNKILYKINSNNGQK